LFVESPVGEILLPDSPEIAYQVATLSRRMYRLFVVHTAAPPNMMQRASADCYSFVTPMPSGNCHHWGLQNTMQTVLTKLLAIGML
jgi:hypothetical protein